MSNKKMVATSGFSPYFLFVFYLFYGVSGGAVLVLECLVVDKWFDWEVSTEHTVVSPEELVIVGVFVVFVFEVVVVVFVHIVGIVDCVLVHSELNVHQGVLNAQMVQDFLKNTAVVGVVRVDDGAYRYCVIERVAPVVGAEVAEDGEAELVVVEVNLGRQI